MPTSADLLAELLALRLPAGGTDRELAEFNARVIHLSACISAAREAEFAALERTRYDAQQAALSAHRQAYLDRLGDLADAATSVSADPPAELDAPWYLETMRPEFVEFNWPTTLQGAVEHWRTWGKPEGRRGRPGGPGWGPLWNSPDRPPHLTR